MLLTNVATWSERHFSQVPASTGTIYVWLGGEGARRLSGGAASPPRQRSTVNP